ncbi:hypothetical protein L914_09055 [Phytophthora nicotianae]|nr:hypothetical protein L914_09055 [Phytophthora nicotianae]
MDTLSSPTYMYALLTHQIAHSRITSTPLTSPLSSTKRSMRLPVTALLLSLASLSLVTNAAECTDSEATYANSLWEDAAATSACAQYVVATNPVYINAPCTATDCVGVMEGVAENLPSCTFSGVSNKIELQNALTVCNGGNTEDAGSPTTVTEAPITPTSTTSTSMSSSTTDCTTDEYTRSSRHVRMLTALVLFVALGNL